MKTLFFLIAAIFGGVANAQHEHHHPPGDRPSVHGMLVVGGAKVYLSHLPMFHTPHDYQAIFEALLPAPAQAAFMQAMASDPGESVYTLEPENFVLPEMAASPRPFKAVLYKGHFERGGSPITGEITVTIRKVVHFEKLDASAERPASYQAILFGDADQQFLAHKISARPDFDQVLRVKSAVTDGVVSFGSSDAQQPLKAGEVLTTQDGKTLEVLRDHYLEFGDLR